VPGADARKRRRKRRKRPKEERDAEECVARMRALDRAERGLDARKAEKIARFASTYGIQPGHLVHLAGKDYTVTEARTSYFSATGFETEAKLREVPKARTILGSRVDLLIVDDLGPETPESFPRALGKVGR
jgi:tRNA(Met) C34 N-acetyltransferase TmcA